MLQKVLGLKFLYHILKIANIIYFILSSAINAYLKQIKMVFSQNQMILYQSQVID